MYAIIDDRGNQLKVAEDDVVNLDLLEAETGSEVVFDRVLLTSDDGDVKVGKPALEGVRVVGEVLGDFKGRKVTGVSFRRRKGSKVKTGHREKFTRVRIKAIET